MGRWYAMIVIYDCMLVGGNGNDNFGDNGTDDNNDNNNSDRLLIVYWL